MNGQPTSSPNQRPIAIYGSTGITGGLILDRALAAGYRPRLVGRPSERLSELSDRHALEKRQAAYDDASALDAALAGCEVMINVAGPFVETAIPIVEACMRTGVHYLDLSGELASVRKLLALDDRARAAGIVVVPGAGFGIAASDVLARRVNESLGGADTLRISVAADTAFASPAVAASTLAVLAGGGCELRDGEFISTRLARRRWREELPCASRHSFASAPLAELACGWRTGVRDVVAGVPMPASQAVTLSIIAPLLTWLIKVPAIARLLSSTGGHVARSRRSGFHSRVWVSGTKDRHCMTLLLEGGEGFALAADIAVRALKALETLDVAPGACTPAAAFGCEWLDGAPGLGLTTLTST